MLKAGTGTIEKCWCQLLEVHKGSILYLLLKKKNFIRRELWLVFSSMAKTVQYIWFFFIYLLKFFELLFLYNDFSFKIVLMFFIFPSSFKIYFYFLNCGKSSTFLRCTNPFFLDILALHHLRGPTSRRGLLRQILNGFGPRGHEQNTYRHTLGTEAFLRETDHLTF